jgi:hypothetical protein
LLYKILRFFEYGTVFVFGRLNEVGEIEDVKVGMVGEMLVYDEVSQSTIYFFVRFVFYYAEEIETREDGFGKIDVVSEGDLLVVVASDRVCCGYDRAPSSKG